jgi:iron(III) transport system ATP-binding protein
MRGGRFEQIGTPVEIYERPATEWVARFVGEANLLDARLADWSASTEIGRVPLFAPATGPGTVMVRPEQLALEPGEGATVDAITYAGRDTTYEVVLGSGTRLSARVPGVPRHSRGDVVAPRFAGSAAQAWLAG